MNNCMCEDYDKAKANRVKQAQDNASKPYYWWEYSDPFEAQTKATITSVSNPKGLARSRRELRERQGYDS